MIACAIPAIAFAGDRAPPEPEGYRTDIYRAPVPETLDGAVVVDTDAAFVLWYTGRVAFIDVYPKPRKPANLGDDALWIDPTRDSIPGAAWVPNVGFGKLPPDRDAGFRQTLSAMTGGDAGAPVLFFCLEDCWMSWNAAKRAMTEYGYTTVFWYPAGTDGWAASGHPLDDIAVPETYGG
ncbi:MAG: PQQ-dependent catabolism-associated CXXCW motif protein [Pseudomonadota bacterium]